MSANKLIFICICQLTFVLYTKSTHEQCNVIIHNDFENCRYQNRVDSSNHLKLGLRTCKNTSVCARQFKISYVKLQPYYEWKDLVEIMINFCCGVCANLVTDNEFDENAELNMKSLSTSDFVFPFLAPTSAFQVYGFYFIPIMDVPSVYYITIKRRSPKETVLDMVKACAELWPMLLVCILLAAISGFFVWLVETWHNPEQFPRSFFIGLFDGFWWAFVSMTTVGYGDKVPKSWKARGIAVVWILTGITICSLFTATLTGKIITGLSSEDMEMQGKKIGWLKPRLFEAKMIANNGGRIYPVDGYDYVEGIKELISMLGNNTIHGLVLDKNMYNLFKSSFSSNKSDPIYDERIASIFLKQTLIRELSNTGEKLSYGLLVKSSLNNIYFRRYFTDNKLQVKSCNMFRLDSNPIGQSKDINLFTLEAGLFWPSFGVCLGALACIAGFGGFYESLRLQLRLHLRAIPHIRRKERSVTDHTGYQRKWINLYKNGEEILGTNKEENFTKRQLRNELSKQGISVLYLDHCDILLFDQSERKE